MIQTMTLARLYLLHVELRAAEHLGTDGVDKNSVRLQTQTLCACCV